MFDDKNIDRNDVIGRQLDEIKKQVTPPPALEKAVMAGVPYGKRVGTATHVFRFAKAVAAYVVGVALFLGVVMLLPRLFESGEPVGNPAATTDPAPPNLNLPNVIPHTYESVGSPERGTMSAEMEAEIKQAFADGYDDVTPDDVKVRFVANINGKYAIYLDVAGWMHLTAVTEEMVYGLNFISSNSNTMKIYAYGRFYSLPDAYTKGVLSAREVQELYVVSHYTAKSQEMREKCALRYGAASDDFFVRFIENGSTDGENWYAVYLYGPFEVRDEITVERVDKREFYYSSTRTMEIYYQGEFYTLSQAFENGIVDDFDLWVLYEEHLELCAYEPLSAGMDARIKVDWQSSYGDELVWENDGGHFRYYGTYRDCVVLFQPTSDEAVTVLKVGEFRFEYMNTFNIFVYHNGEFTDLQAAYQNGLIDYDTLNVLAGVHYEFNR